MAEENQGLMAGVEAEVKEEEIQDEGMATANPSDVVEGEDIEGVEYERPDEFPTKFWDEKEGPDIENLVKSYNNLEKKSYPSMLITTSLFDNRVLYSEPVKYIAKLRDLKDDNNIQLLKCKMEAAGHGGMSGRDNAIKELAEEYSFILKTANILI